MKTNDNDNVNNFRLNLRSNSPGRSGGGAIFSFLVCITAMVRVEIINQRIDVVEDFMAEVNQIANVHVGRDVTGLKNVQKVNLVGEFYCKNGVKEEEYTSKGKLDPLQYFTRGGTPL